MQQVAEDAPVQMPGVALVLRPGLKAGDTPPRVVGVERQVEANGVVDATDKTHAGFFHDAASLCLSHYSIVGGFGQALPSPSSGRIASWEGADPWDEFGLLTNKASGCIMSLSSSLHSNQVVHQDFGDDSLNPAQVSIGCVVLSLFSI